MVDVRKNTCCRGLKRPSLYECWRCVGPTISFYACRSLDKCRPAVSQFQPCPGTQLTRVRRVWYLLWRCLRYSSAIKLLSRAIFFALLSCGVALVVVVLTQVLMLVALVVFMFSRSSWRRCLLLLWCWSSFSGFAIILVWSSWTN